ncbi:unnamed protein product, partial [Symbiodinium microadriaticum]
LLHVDGAVLANSQPNETDPKPSHVVFLTSKYQRRYALFETERLIRRTLAGVVPVEAPVSLQQLYILYKCTIADIRVGQRMSAETKRALRKTLFTFIGALLPIDSSPALQMGCLGIVVAVSLFLYCRYKPYHSPEWNWIEICLLFAATVMITSVSTLLANEFHWGHSVPTQQSIIFATAGIAAVASCLVKQRRVDARPFFAISKGVMRAAAIALAPGLWITGCAVRPSREEVRQLLETEADGIRPKSSSEPIRSFEISWVNLALRFRGPETSSLRCLGQLLSRPVLLFWKANQSLVAADYPLCDGLPRNGIRVIDTAHVISTNCTWHGHLGLQVTLKETLTFRGNLVLKGEIQIMGEQELDGINVSGKLTVIAANVSFVGCRNRMQDGKGGALFIQRDFIVSNSGVKFQNCRASRGGGGLYTDGSFSQEAESMVTFEDCTASSLRGLGGGALVWNAFTQGPKSSAIFRSCSALQGGGLFGGDSFSQAEESTVTFEKCTSSGSDGGGAYVNLNFTQGRNSSAIFRSCRASKDGAHT